MTRTLITLAALTLISGLAAAQSSVTIYGVTDVGLITQNKAPAGAAKTTLSSGGVNPNHLGFRGAEDLGGGLKAIFALEIHYSPDTGATDPKAFRRQSNVGFSSETLGTLKLGNQYSPAILAFAATDPRGLRENFSGLYPWAFNSGALTRGNNGNNDVGVFIQNAISYSHKFGPVGIAGSYSPSENLGAVTSLGVTYSGPFSLSAAYQGTNLPRTSSRQSEIYTVGAGYTFGDFTGKVNYLRGRNRNAALVETSNVGVAGFGLDWATSPNNVASAAVYIGKDRNNSQDKTNSLILSDEYSLSKRTKLYAAYIYADAKAGATLLTTIVNGGTVPNAKTSLLNLGIKHSF